MPSFCAARNCELKYNKTENVSFHKFPQYNIELRKKWIKFTGRENWEPSRWSALCSRHFKPEDFKNKKLVKNSSRMSLKLNAYPIIIPKNSKETNSISNNTTKTNITSDQDSCSVLKLNCIETTKSQELKVKIESVIPVSTTNYQKNFMTQSKDLPSSIFTTIHSCPNSSTDELFRSRIDFNREQNSNSLTLNQLNTMNSLDLSNTSNDNPTNQINSLIKKKTNFINPENQNCRLCSNGIDASDSAVSFSTDFEIFGMLQKCFPTLNMQQEDNYPKNICSFCLEKLDDFSDFIDLVIESQKSFDIRFQKLPTRNERIKIKQEPNLRIKQEAAENITLTQNEASFEQNKADNGGDEHLILNQHSDSPDFDEIEQKSHFYDLPVLDAKDMDIMEIISLDDAFIDIDEMTNDAGNLSDSDLLNITSSLKSIENDENDKMKKNEVKDIVDGFILTNETNNVTDKIDFQKELSNYSVDDTTNILSKCSKIDSNKIFKNEFHQNCRKIDSEVDIFRNRCSRKTQIQPPNNATENIKNDLKSGSINIENLHERTTNQNESDVNDKKENLFTVNNKEEDVKHVSKTEKHFFYDPFHEHNYTKYYGEHNYKTEQVEHETDDLEENLQNKQTICSQDIVDLSTEDMKPLSGTFESTKTDNNDRTTCDLIVESEDSVNSEIIIETPCFAIAVNNNYLSNENYDALPGPCTRFAINNCMHPVNHSISSINSTNLSTNNPIISSVINIDQNMYSNTANKTAANNNPKQSIVVLNESILKPSLNLLTSKSDCPLRNTETENFMQLQGEKIQTLYKPSVICTYLCEFCNSNFDSFFELLNHRNSCEFKNSSEKSDLLNICCNDYAINQTQKTINENNNSLKKPIRKNKSNNDPENGNTQMQCNNLLLKKNVKDNKIHCNTENLNEIYKLKAFEYQTMLNESKATIDNGIISKNVGQVNNDKQFARNKTNLFPVKPIKISCKMCSKQFETKVALNNHKKYLCAFKQKSDGFYCKYCNCNFRKWIQCRQHEKKCKLNYKKKNRRNLRIHKSKGIPFNEPPKILENIQMLKPKIDLTVIDLNYEEFDVNKQQEQITNINNNQQNNLLLIISNESNEILLKKNTFSNNLKSIQNHISSDYEINNQLLSIPIEQNYFAQNLSAADTSIKQKSQTQLFNCEKCDKQFNALKNLIQHKITHTNIRNYQCHLCKDKFFKRSNGLNQHIKSVHEGLKPYNCPICNHCYALKGDAIRCRHSSLKI